MVRAGLKHLLPRHARYETLFEDTRRREEDNQRQRVGDVGLLACHMPPHLFVCERKARLSDDEGRSAENRGVQPRLFPQEGNAAAARGFGSCPIALPLHSHGEPCQHVLACSDHAFRVDQDDR